MNKETIKKYKAEFNHWLYGGNVQVYYKKDSDPRWWTDKESIDYDGIDNFRNIIKNSLSLTDVVIVIDDEYVEYRKALAEGKTIQYYVDGFVGWQDVKSLNQSYMHPNSFRIKPEEPKFKIGDWVRDLRDNRIFQINSENFNLNLSITNGVYELWYPKLGEWCWFWNSNGSPVLEQFSKYHKLNKHKHCEPFIGELPTNLKDSNES